MKAISIVPRTNHLELLEIEAPQIKKQASDIDKVLIKVEEIGVSTIDKRIASGEPCEPPPGSSHIILGHEMKGRVVDIGAEAEGFNIGDLVVPTVRCGCSAKLFCSENLKMEEAYDSRNSATEKRPRDERQRVFACCEGGEDSLHRWSGG